MLSAYAKVEILWLSSHAACLGTEVLYVANVKYSTHLDHVGWTVRPNYQLVTKKKKKQKKIIDK